MARHSQVSSYSHSHDALLQAEEPWRRWLRNLWSSVDESDAGSHELWDKNAIEKNPAKMAKLEEQIAVLVVNYGISNTIVLEIL